VVKDWLGAHPASYALIPENLSPGVKRLGHEANHSSSASVEIKERGYIHHSTIRLHDIVLMSVKHRGNFTYYIYVVIT
jgi:hypothetical protein